MPLPPVERIAGAESGAPTVPWATCRLDGPGSRSAGRDRPPGPRRTARRPARRRRAPPAPVSAWSAPKMPSVEAVRTCSGASGCRAAAELPGHDRAAAVTGGDLEARPRLAAPDLRRRRRDASAGDRSAAGPAGGPPTCARQPAGSCQDQAATAVPSGATDRAGPAAECVLSEIVRVALRVPSAATKIARIRCSGLCLRTVRTIALPSLSSAEAHAFS